jgi:tripartite-type tricarboxylate transporter receptor subunit TctC
MPISSTFVVLPVMQPKLPLDLARDIVPIGLVGEQPMAIAVHRSLGVNSLAELVTMARQRPGKVLFGAGRLATAHPCQPPPSIRGKPRRRLRKIRAAASARFWHPVHG